MLRKLSAMLLIVLLCGGAASAEIVGRHSMVNFSEQDAAVHMSILPGEIFISVDPSCITVKFFDSLSVMLMALGKGEIDSITVPRAVGNYILKNNADFTLKAFNWWNNVESTLSFGSSSENAELMNKFNEAITAMKQDGTLPLLEKKYIDMYDTRSVLPPVTFENFADAGTITAAVTGDLPPIDYVDASGTPAGFNAAVLAEIGRRLHLNIKTVNVDTGARITALTSGRVDVIFWVRGYVGNGISIKEPFIDKVNNDTVILSEPYYYWHEQYFIGRK